MKIKITEIKAGQKSGFSMFHGEGDAVKGFFITFEVIEGSGMFYAGQSSCVAYPGKEACFWFPVASEGEALAEISAEAEILEAEEISVLNLTQHQATAEQSAAGVVEPAEKSAVQAALTFDAIPTASEIAERAEFLARIAVDSGCRRAMIGGAPFFMSALERALFQSGIQPVYAFSVRDSKEESDGNGGVRKVNVFRHVGFVESVF